MAVRATVLPQPEPGHAILRLTELLRDLESSSGSDSHTCVALAEFLENRGN